MGKAGCPTLPFPLGSGNRAIFGFRPTPLGIKTTAHYVDAEGSATSLLKEVQTPRNIPDDIIHPALEKARCDRYHLKYAGRKERRRIFYGSNIADDSWQVISIHALEFFGIFHTVAFSESK